MWGAGGCWLYRREYGRACAGYHEPQQFRLFQLWLSGMAPSTSRFTPSAIYHDSSTSTVGREHLSRIVSSGRSSCVDHHDRHETTSHPVSSGSRTPSSIYPSSPAQVSPPCSCLSSSRTASTSFQFVRACGVNRPFSHERSREMTPGKTGWTPLPRTSPTFKLASFVSNHYPVAPVSQLRSITTSR